MLKDIPTEEIRKELRRRKGIEYLQNQIKHIEKIETHVFELSKLKEEAFSKITFLSNGGDYEGEYPELKDLTFYLQELSDLAY
jgi:hypothetical protein